jgi:hypothetical protein
MMMLEIRYSLANKGIMTKATNSITIKPHLSKGMGKIAISLA